MNTETIKALLSAVGVIIVASLGAVGIDVDADALQNVLSAVLFLAAMIYGVWKNHNFTKAAQEAQKLLDSIKKGEVPGNDD